MEIKNLPGVASEGAAFTIDGVEHVFFRFEPSEPTCQHCPMLHAKTSKCEPCTSVKGSSHYGVMPLTTYVVRALDKD